MKQKKTEPYIYIDPRSKNTKSITGFTLSEEHWLTLHAIVERGFDLSCDVIAHRDFWRDEWSRCPICSSVVKDGHITHVGGQ